MGASWGTAPLRDQPSRCDHAHWTRTHSSPVVSHGDAESQVHARPSATPHNHTLAGRGTCREGWGCLDVLVGGPVTHRYRGGCAGREPTHNRARCMPSHASVRVSCRAIMEAVHSGACRRGQRTDADGVLSRTCAAHLVSAGSGTALSQGFSDPPTALSHRRANPPRRTTRPSFTSR